VDENHELRLLHARLLRAYYAEDIFELTSDDPDEQLLQVREDYRFMSRMLDPEKYINREDTQSLEILHEAQELLDRFYAEAEEKIERGEFDPYRCGKTGDDDFIIKTRERSYRIKKKQFAEGELSSVFEGYFDDGDFAQSVLVKILDEVVDIEAMRNEARILKLFAEHPDDRLVHLPVLLDQFRTTDNRMGLIFKRFRGHSIEEVLKLPRYKDGIPEKHVVWMFNRLLRVLGYVHDLGVIHGNIDPSHLIIQPYSHNLCLIGWSYAVYDPCHTGESFKVYNEDYSAPEVLEKRPPVPPSDLYSVGKCMIRMLGGDIEIDTMPATVDIRLQRFIRFFVIPSVLGRARDGDEMQEKLVELIEEMWGPRRFLEFVI
jgi:serine/threonine protein kinase